MTVPPSLSGNDRKLDTSVKDIRTTRLDRPLWHRTSRAPPRPTASRPNDDDVGQRPPERDRTGKAIVQFYISENQNIFDLEA
jgi:hypothetical protein